MLKIAHSVYICTERIIVVVVVVVIVINRGYGLYDFGKEGRVEKDLPAATVIKYCDGGQYSLQSVTLPIYRN